MAGRGNGDENEHRAITERVSLDTGQDMYIRKASSERLVEGEAVPIAPVESDMPDKELTYRVESECLR